MPIPTQKMPIPASLNKNLTPAGDLRADVHRFQPRSGHCPVPERRHRLLPGAQRPPKELLDEWLTRIRATLAESPNAAPFAVNQIIHPSNERLEHDMALCVKHEVPLIITSLSAPTQIVPHVHAYGGKVFHDVISVRHAEKALEAGVDGLILVCAGAGGHAGTLEPVRAGRRNPQVLRRPDCAVRRHHQRPGHSLAAQALGADFAYIGTRFIATHEANAVDAYKQAIIDSAAKDVVYTPYFTGVHGNYLKKSIVAAGLDPANLPEKDKSSMNFGAAAATPRPGKTSGAPGRASARSTR